LAFTRYCHYQNCIVCGVQQGDRGGVVYCATVVQWHCSSVWAMQVRRAMTGWLIRAEKASSKRTSCKGQGSARIGGVSAQRRAAVLGACIGLYKMFVCIFRSCALLNSIIGPKHLLHFARLYFFTKTISRNVRFPLNPSLVCQIPYTTHWYCQYRAKSKACTARRYKADSCGFGSSGIAL